MLAPMRGITTSALLTSAPDKYRAGFPRDTTIWKSSGSMTVTSWPRARAARTIRLVEYSEALRDRTSIRMGKEKVAYLDFRSDGPGHLGPASAPATFRRSGNVRIS